MTTVKIRPNESSDALFRRFKKKVIKAGTLGDVRKKRWFVSRSEERREAKKKAARRMRRRQYNANNGSDR